MYCCTTRNDIYIYGAETWAVKKAQEKTLNVAEMKVLRWMCGITKMNRIWNERNRGTTKMGEITKKVQERRHVMRMHEEYVGKRVMRMNVEGRRKRRPKLGLMDSVNVDLREKGLSGEGRITRLC